MDMNIEIGRKNFGTGIEGKNYKIDDKSQIVIKDLRSSFDTYISEINDKIQWNFANERLIININNILPKLDEMFKSQESIVAKRDYLVKVRQIYNTFFNKMERKADAFSPEKSEEETRMTSNIHSRWIPLRNQLRFFSHYWLRYNEQIISKPKEIKCPHFKDGDYYFDFNLCEKYAIEELKSLDEKRDYYLSMFEEYQIQPNEYEISTSYPSPKSVIVDNSDYNPGFKPDERIIEEFSTYILKDAKIEKWLKDKILVTEYEINIQNNINHKDTSSNPTEKEATVDKSEKKYSEESNSNPNSLPRSRLTKTLDEILSDIYDLIAPIKTPKGSFGWVIKNGKSQIDFSPTWYAFEGGYILRFIDNNRIEGLAKSFVEIQYKGKGKKRKLKSYKNIEKDLKVYDSPADKTHNYDIKLFQTVELFVPILTGHYSE